MPRAALFTLLIASILDGSLQAQRGTATFHGSSAARLPVRSGFVGRHGLTNRSFANRSHLSRDRFNSVFVPYFFPDDEPFGYEQPDGGAVTTPVVILQPDAWQSQTPEPPPPKAHVIEIPGVATSTAAKLRPPTLFILVNGERLETRRFLLTVSSLSVSIDRRPRTIPFDMLDIDATITANHERGIDLQIPVDRTEISLSF